MKIRQTARHFAAKQVLELPGVRDAAAAGLVRLHTRIFLANVDPDHRDERREHLDDLFAATIGSLRPATPTTSTLNRMATRRTTGRPPE